MPQIGVGGGGGGQATNPTPASPNPPSTNNGLSYQNYQQYVSQAILAARIGSQAGIPNSLATSELDTALLTDPQQVKAYRTSIADQMNVQSAGPRFEDLSDRIADIVLSTTAQGANTVEVHIIDPMWALLTSGFVTTDELGFLWPPIEMRFPSDTQMTWRLCSLRWSRKPQPQGNVQFTFEDQAVSLLRQMSPLDGIYQGLPNQTMGGFFQMLVDNTNQTLHSQIKLVQMLDPTDPNYTVPITVTGNQKPLRQNPSKSLTGILNGQQTIIDNALGAINQIFGGVQSTTFAQAEAEMQGLLKAGQLQARNDSLYPYPSTPDPLNPNS